MRQVLVGTKVVCSMHVLAKADPGNAGWQPDLSLSQERIGDVLCAQGNLAELAADFVLMLPRRKVLGKDDRPEAPIPAE
jgi:hypothetical protein